MRVLWIVNTPIYIDENHSTSTRGGWMEGALRGIKSEIEVSVAFPCIEEKKSEKIGKITYYYFHYNQFGTENIAPEAKLGERLCDIIQDVQPDIIHVWGTEYMHSFAAICAAESLGMIQKVVVNLQGLVSIYAKHYLAGLPYQYDTGNALKNRMIKKDLKKNQSIYAQKGEYEKTIIEKINHVIGRTDWDKACALQINPKIQYYCCNETLRPRFYSGRKWNINQCIPYSLFITQPWHPIKGFHNVLESVAILKKTYRDVMIYATGKNLFLEKKKRTGYVCYLYHLIQKYDLENNIRFLGELDELQMKEQFLKMHIFVSASSVENESNALSEAHFLGVPVVASYVGGVTGRIKQGEDGFLYPYNEPYMLAYYISEIFADSSLAEKFSRNGMAKAAILNNAEINKKRLLSIYHIINGDEL